MICGLLFRCDWGCSQVGWVLSVPTSVYEARGVQFDALAFATSKQRREVHSSQDATKSSTEAQHQVLQQRDQQVARPVGA